MGLITGIYNMVRQSEEDDFRRREAEVKLAMQMRYQERQEKAYQNMLDRRESVKNALTELSDLDSRISDNDFQKKLLEESLQRIPDPMEQMKAMTQIKIISKQNEDLNRLRNLRSAQMDYEIVDAGIAKAKSIDLVDAKNGLKPQKDTGMATIRRENVIGYDENDEPIKETISYKVPYTQVESGQSQQGQSAYGNMGMSTYQAGNPLLPNITADQAMRDASSTMIQSYGNSMMFQPNQPEISAPAQQAPATTPSQAQPSIDPAQVRAEALQILNNPNIPPDKKEKVRQRAALS